MQSSIHQRKVNTQKFIDNFESLISGIYQFIEELREFDLLPICEDGVTRFIEADGKLCFQVSSQFHRPDELLQSTLDMVRACFDPNPLGTFFLNGNPNLFTDNLPECEWSFGYLSMVIDSHIPFLNTWENTVVPTLQQYGYLKAATVSQRVVVSTGTERYGPEMIDEILSALNSGWTPDQAIDLFIDGHISDVSDMPMKNHAALVCVPELEHRLRISVWSYLRFHFVHPIYRTN